MKSILLIRHAKSSWDDPSMSDFDRPLNERGKKNAPEMAIRLHDKNIRPDLLISSPAKRAHQTAKAFARVFAMDTIQLEESLYLPAPGAFLKLIKSLPPAVRTVALFSHNPGITDFANMFNGIRIDNIPTAGIAGLTYSAEAWTDFQPNNCNFWFLDYPKSNP